MNTIKSTTAARLSHTEKVDGLKHLIHRMEGAPPLTAQPDEGKLLQVYWQFNRLSFHYLAAAHVAAGRFQNQYWLRGYVRKEDLVAYTRAAQLNVVYTDTVDADLEPVRIKSVIIAEDFVRRYFRQVLQSYLDSGREPVQWS